MLYDPDLDYRLDSIDGKNGMLGVIVKTKTQANSLHESLQNYEGQLDDLKKTDFFKAMKDLKESVIE